jgi:hypothetical protein
MPSFAEYAKKGMKKHPEIASALMEFEKTKKLPKTSYRKRIDVTINENILKEVRSYCEKNGMNMSKIIEKCMIQELEKNKK